MDCSFILFIHASTIDFFFAIPGNVCTRITIYYTTSIFYAGCIVSVRRMVMDEIRPNKIVLLTRAASRGVTDLYLS